MSGQIFCSMTAPMRRAEARATLARLRGSLRDCRLMILDLYERQGWKALGYSSWRDFCQVELERSVSYVWRLLQAAKVEMGFAHGQKETRPSAIPERQLRELARLDTVAERQAVYEEAQADGDVTAEALKNLVDNYQGNLVAKTEEDDFDAHEFAKLDRGGHPSPAAASNGTFWNVLVGGKLYRLSEVPDNPKRVVEVRPGDVLKFVSA